MQLGIDLGGTKTEVIILDQGQEVFRHRVPSAQNDYEASVKTIRDLVLYAEEQVGEKCSIGMGMPGTISPITGLVKNANSTWLNGKALDKDLSHAIGRKVRATNDANCLAVSEAADGAAAGKNVVFAFILGTGSGSGIVVNGQIMNGRTGNGGEYGHTPLAWPTEEEFTHAPSCYCGQKGCFERWVSGSGFQDDYARLSGKKLKGHEITILAEQGDKLAVKAVQGYKSRLGRAMAMITNILDPDIFVLGGGMSNAPFIDETMADYVLPYTFGGEFNTPIVKAKYGDSSGVRGAAWLWREDEFAEALKSFV